MVKAAPERATYGTGSDRTLRGDSVRLVREGSKSLPQVAKDLDLTESALRNWVREADGRQGQGVGRRAHHGRAGGVGAAAQGGAKCCSSSFLVR